MRRIILAALFIAIAAAGVVASNPSRADGWQDYSLMTPPYCGGSLCPTPREACLAIAGAWWSASQVEDKLLSCRLLTPTKVRATVVGLCCGDTNNGDSSLTCDAGREPDTDGTGRCVPARDAPRGPRYNIGGAGEAPCEACAGNPIMLAEGNKHQEVVDFATPGPNVLAFVRTYNSHFKTNVAGFPMPLGIKWQSNFDRYLVNTSSTVKTLYRPDGTVIKFTKVSTVWAPPADLPVELAQSGTDWVFTDIDDTVETYNSSFKLTTIAPR